MIRVFNHLKRTLINEGKLGRYAVYALGEIILIVIGILIAIQIDDWNQQQKNSKQEKAIIADLRDEFKSNQKNLAEVRVSLGKAIESCYTLMELMNKGEEYLSDYDIDFLLFWSLEYPAFHPSDNVLREILQTGRLGLLQDKELKTSLFDWARNVENSKVELQVFLGFKQTEFLPYLLENATMKNIDAYGPMQWEDRSEFPAEDHLIFQDKKFENLLDNLLYHMMARDKELAAIDRNITQVLERTKSQ